MWLFAKYIFYFFIIISLTSCSAIYNASRPNISLLNEKKSFNGEVGVGAEGLSVKSAYAPIKRFTLQANGHIMSTTNGNKYQYIEVNGGYSFKIDKLYVDMLIGNGWGTSSFNDPISGSDYHLTSANGNFTKQFLQLNYGLNSNKKYLIGGAVLVGIVNYQYEYANIPSISGKTVKFYSLEPYLLFRRKFSDIVSLSCLLGTNIIKVNKGMNSANWMIDPQRDIRAYPIKLDISIGILIGAKQE